MCSVQLEARVDGGLEKGIQSDDADHCQGNVLDS